MAGQIVLGHCAAVRFGMGSDATRQSAGVKRLAMAVGDGFQRAGMGFAAKNLTGMQRTATGQKAIGKAGLVA